MAQFTTSDGHVLAFDDVNPAGREAIVLVHGFTSNRQEGWRRTGWIGVFERKGMRVLALDCRGHGESAKPHDPAAYGRDRMVRDVLELMDACALTRADLLGFSMGAHLALGAALAAPERFKSLILGGVGAMLLEPNPRERPLAEALEADDPETIADPLVRSFRLFADEQGEDRLALAACARGQREVVTPAALAALDLPTLVVAGARDDLAGPAAPLAAAIPGAKSVTIPGCDHFAVIPHALFKAAVMDFLEGWLD